MRGTRGEEATQPTEPPPRVRRRLTTRYNPIIKPPQTRSAA
ncbi:hypothetical protein [Vreelandella nigrificans]|nr:hypothetical protein [Halomonas nigrificans]